MDFSTINWLAVLVAAVASFAIGSLWYSPVLFGKVWQREAEMTDEKIKNGNMAKIFGLAFVLSFIISLCLALFFAGQVSFTEGLMYGFFTGAFWVAAALGILYLFEHKSLKLWFINAGYHIVTFTVMGGILGAWH